MPQGLTAYQHSSLVQFPPSFVLPAGIDLALVLPPCPTVYPIIGDVLNLPGMGLINGRGILGPVAVNIGALVDVLPHLFLAGCILYPLYDLRCIWADDGAQALPAALSIADRGEVIFRK